MMFFRYFWFPGTQMEVLGQNTEIPVPRVLTSLGKPVGQTQEVPQSVILSLSKRIREVNRAAEVRGHTDEIGGHGSVCYELLRVQKTCPEPQTSTGPLRRHSLLKPKLPVALCPMRSQLFRPFCFLINEYKAYSGPHC